MVVDSDKLWIIGFALGAASNLPETGQPNRRHSAFDTGLDLWENQIRGARDWAAVADSVSPDHAPGFSSPPQRSGVGF
jgi:hypothetical protein